MSLNLKAGIKENLIQSSDLFVIITWSWNYEKAIKIKPRDMKEKRLTISLL